MIARALRSPEVRRVGSIAALLVVGGIAWLIADGQRQAALRKQQYEQERQTEERSEAQQAEAERQAEAREAAQRLEEAQRQAAIAAQQAAAEHEAAAERAAVISATDLSSSNVTLQNTPRDIGFDLTGTITNHSGQTLRYLEFEVTLKDCPLGPGQCQVVAQQSGKPLVEIPPNQTRAFTAYLDFPNVPQNPQDQRFFSWRIITASSCSQVNLSAHKCAKTNSPSNRPQSAL